MDEELREWERVTDRDRGEREERVREEDRLLLSLPLLLTCSSRAEDVCLEAVLLDCVVSEAFCGLGTLTGL